MEKEVINEKEVVNVEKVKNELTIKGVGELGNNRKSEQQVFTSIEDPKVIFNLNNNCDYKLNDVIDEVIRVKDILVKLIKTPLEEPIVDEETGDVKEFEFKKITILIDDTGKSYVTASKMFANQFIDYLMMFGYEQIKSEGLEIKIIKRSVKNSSNKALGFELV